MIKKQKIQSGPVDFAGAVVKKKIQRRIVFFGNPNAGKTTLFNRLTGLRAKTANYPGTTVEVRIAQIEIDRSICEWVDLPGLYSLDGQGADERVAADYLDKLMSDDAVPTQIVLVVDATRMERGLCLAAQLQEKVATFTVVLNMMDIANKQRLSIDRACLESELGMTVVPVSARSGEGLITLTEILGAECTTCAAQCAIKPLLCNTCGSCPHTARFAWAEELSRKACGSDRAHVSSQNSARIDRVATHSIWGSGVFLLVMAGLFQTLFLLAEAPMGWIEFGFALLADTLSELLPEGLLHSFIVDGLITGLAGTVIFLPQICLLFFLVALLEDSGYLARAAFVVDKWMVKVGLPGRAFVPMLSAHACAIPAIMSTRAVENPRDRLVTILILPLLSCSARIPVYIMVTAMLFADRPLLAGAVFTGAYFMGLIAALGMAWLFKKTLLKGDAKPLLIELPDYKLPSLRTALWTAFDRGMIFLKRVGGVILLIIVGLWVLSAFPRMDIETLRPDQLQVLEALKTDAPETDWNNALAAWQLEQSFAGRIGHTLQPVFAPLGFDWQITVGVLASFAAREVIASTLAVLHGMGEEGGDDTIGVAERLREAVEPAVGLSLLVFFILAMQCLPTQVITRRETGSWRWAALQFSYMSALAYSAAWLTYQLSSRLL
jgi:ferrous iron transport protein B